MKEKRSEIKTRNGQVRHMLNISFSRQHSHGFTLIELLVVIAIIALLVSILLPSLNKAKEMTRNVMCMTNQKSIVLAANIYRADNGQYPRNLGVDERFPTGLEPNKLTRDWDGDGRAYSDGEKISDYLDDVTFEHFVCPRVKVESARYATMKGYYDSGASAWLYSSYAFYWNYSLRPSSGNTFIGPGIDGNENSRLLTSDMCLYNSLYSRWFISHPPESESYGSGYYYGFVWDVQWPDPDSMFRVKINVGSSDGSVTTVNSDDIKPVSFEYHAQYLGVPDWAVQ